MEDKIRNSYMRIAAEGMDPLLVETQKLDPSIVDSYVKGDPNTDSPNITIWVIYVSRKSKETATQRGIAERVRRIILTGIKDLDYPVDALMFLRVNFTSQEEIEAKGGSANFFK